MRKSSPIQWVYRVLIYCLGMFSLALGVAVSANSQLGISPVNSLPYVVSDIFQKDPGTCVTVVFCVYILLQVLILRKEFKIVNLTQIVFSTIFGYFVNLTKAMVGDWAIPGYPGKLVMLAISILLIALGVLLYLDVELVPMPMEGLSLAISKKTGVVFTNMKIIVDCTVVVIGVVLSLIFLGGFAPFLNGTARIREGTVITAIVTGKIIALLKKPLTPIIKKICFGGVEAEVK